MSSLPDRPITIVAITAGIITHYIFLWFAYLYEEENVCNIKL